MLTTEYRRRAHSTCAYGHKCCDNDGRSHREVRRTARRTEKQAWKRELTITL